MRILLINSDCGYGSTGRICVDLYQLIIESGNEACIAYGRECTNRSVRSIRIGNPFHVYQHALKTRVMDGQGFGSKRATKKFIRKCREYDPDIIHLHNLHGSYLNIELLFHYIKNNHIPVIWTLHDCWSFTGHCAYYTYANCFKWKTGCYHCEQKKVYPASYLLDNARNNYKRKKQLFHGIENMKITTVSSWLMEEVKQSYLKEYDIHVIPNGLDLTVFQPTKSEFRKLYDIENKIILLGVASIWHNRKGLWLFAELADQLDPVFQIVLVGITDKQKSQLPDNIIGIKRTNNIKELAEIYTAADIFLNPSIEETFGMVTLEALACGTPVITNQYSANPELIDSSCGVIVEDLTVQCFLKAIHHIIANPIHREECIKKAQNYNLHRCYQMYLDLYKDVYLKKVDELKHKKNLTILWLTNIPSPYRVEFFNELGKFCNLTVLFELPFSDERDCSWNNYEFINFTGIIMDGRQVDVDKAFCIESLKYIKKHKYDYIFISNPATPTGVLAIEYMKLRKIPYILEGDGGISKDGKGIKEALKKHLLKNAMAYFSTSKSHDTYWLTYGALKENVYRYPFTSIRETDICGEYIEKEKKQEIKKALGITVEYVIIAVGRFIRGKGFDVLIKASRQLDKNIEIYLIGGKPLPEYGDLVREYKLTNIHFIDFLPKEQLKQYYYASDLFVLPTRGDSWGLVINEAMACGLPIITTDQCVAGLELIEDSLNGFVIPVDNEDILAQKIKAILENKKLRMEMSYHNINKIKDYTMQAMVKRHIELLTHFKL